MDAETRNMLYEAYNGDALSQTMVYKWFKRFKDFPGEKYYLRIQLTV
jgi:hypothetical protein